MMRCRAVPLLRVVPVIAASAALALVAGCGATHPNQPAGAGGRSVPAPVSTGCGPVTATLASDDVTPLANPASPALPVTVRSADGGDVTVTDVSRILPVNRSGSIADIVFALGLGDRVVGRDTATTFPAAAKLPVVTPGGHDLSAEGILALHPSVVLTDTGTGPATVLSQLRKAGVPVVVLDEANSLDGIHRSIQAVAGALGVPSDGQRLVDRLTSELAAAKAHGNAPVHIAFLYLRGGSGVAMMGGKGAGSDAMIQAIGAVDAGTAIGLTGFRPITSEGMITAAPDVILVMSDGLASVGGVDGLLKLPGVGQTPAGAHRRVVDMDDGVLLSFGTRTGRVAAALADAVYRPC